jgi:hypothetical protein
MHGNDYFVGIKKKIETYIQSLINNCPLPDTYLDEDRAFGCHIKKYIDEFTFERFNFTSIVMDNNLADATVRVLIKHYRDGFDLSIECIKRGMLVYLDHYYKNLEPNVRKDKLEDRMRSIVEFLSANSEFNTTDNITKLHEIYGKEIFDKAMVRMLSNVLNHKGVGIFDNLPKSLSSLDTTSSVINSLSAIDSLSETLAPIKISFPINFDKNDLDIVRVNCSEFNVLKEYYNNFIQDSNILHSLLMDNTHIHNIYNENAQIFADIKSALIS